MVKPAPRIELLGSFRVLSKDELISLSTSTQYVVAFLALRRRRMARQLVAGTLWPEANQHKAQGRLRTALWRLGPERDTLVTADNGHLTLNRRCVIDLYEAEALAQTLADGHPLPHGDLLLEVFSRDLLPAWDEPWINTEREWYRETRVHALEALAARFLSRKDHLRAIRACLYATRISPYRDSSHRLLAEVHIAEGNPSAALQHILDYRKTVQQELNVNPDHVLADLVEQLA